MKTHPLPKPLPEQSSSNIAPLVDPLTTWEAEEQDALLANETRAWRQKRKEAENNDTPGSVLQKLAEQAKAAWENYDDEKKRKAPLLAQALAMHPNTPLDALTYLFTIRPLTARAFCRNPITPFLLLERSDFIANLDIVAQFALLCQADAPPLFVQMLASNKNEGGAAASGEVARAARLHVAYAGEVETREEWEQQLRDYYHAQWLKRTRTIETTEAVDDSEEYLYEGMLPWYADAVELGLAPPWKPSVPLPEPDDLETLTALDDWFNCPSLPGSGAETAQLKRIHSAMTADPHLRVLLARGLRRDAAPTDMKALLAVPESRLGLVWMALLRHPSVPTEVIEEIERQSAPHHGSASRYLPYIVRSPRIPSLLLMEYLQGKDASMRRLARRNPSAPPDAHEIGRRAFITQVDKQADYLKRPLLSFLACMAMAKENEVPDAVWQKMETPYWTDRLEAALLVKPRDEPLPGDPFKRTGRDLLEHLTLDGNRLVRWAAQNRLADPDFTFTWHEESISSQPPI